MDNKPSENAFQEVIRKSKAFRETLGKRSAKQADMRDTDAEEEARREDFDRALQSARAKSQGHEVKLLDPDITQ
jgi:hypothetical protein